MNGIFSLYKTDLKAEQRGVEVELKPSVGLCGYVVQMRRQKKGGEQSAQEGVQKKRKEKEMKNSRFPGVFQFKSASKTNEREIPIQDTAMWLGP